MRCRGRRGKEAARGVGMSAATGSRRGRRERREGPMGHPAGHSSTTFPPPQRVHWGGRGGIQPRARLLVRRTDLSVEPLAAHGRLSMGWQGRTRQKGALTILRLLPPLPPPPIVAATVPAASFICARNRRCRVGSNSYMRRSRGRGRGRGRCNLRIAICANRTTSGCVGDFLSDENEPITHSRPLLHPVVPTQPPGISRSSYLC